MAEIKISKLKASYKLNVKSWKLREVKESIKVEKSLEILVKLTIYKLKVEESCKSLSKSIEKLRKVEKSWQNLTRVAKSWQELTKVDKSWQKSK